MLPPIGLLCKLRVATRVDLQESSGDSKDFQLISGAFRNAPPVGLLYKMWVDYTGGSSRIIRGIEPLFRIFSSGASRQLECLAAASSNRVEQEATLSTSLPTPALYIVI